MEECGCCSYWQDPAIDYGDRARKALEMIEAAAEHREAEEKG